MRKRSCYCGELRLSHEGETVVLQGWVKKVRDYGGVLFVDLRDREGVAQVVFRPEVVSREVMELAASLRPEYVVEVEGQVTSRGENVNPKIPTGQVEVVARGFEVLSEAQTPPFPVEDEITALEPTRLTYRYLDLRRPVMQRNFLFRSRAMKVVTDAFHARGFVQIETPFLSRSTPEGARDYLVPSRIEPGHFYALPQSPQLFKQLLMVSGFDRYFQIVKCFRDEDLRADRQPEFTQIDVEMSFVEPEDIIEIINDLLVTMVRELLGLELEKPGVMTFDEAMDRFGVDNPDVRFHMHLVDLADALRGGGLDVIDKVLAGGGEVVGLRAGNASFSRKDVDNLTAFVKAYGAGGLFWLAREGGGWRGSARKLADRALEAAWNAAGAGDGDMLFFVAGDRKTARTSMGRLRVELAGRLGLIPGGALKAVWVRDFPMFEWDETGGRWVSMHHPFTSPRPDQMDLLETEPAAVRARSYDIVLNGQEIGGGSIRIHRRDVQSRVFQALGIGEEEASAKFGFLLQALSHGAPPHGGIALGFDRILAILLGLDSLRDVIAFPKTTSASCLMTRSPSAVSPQQLEDLGLQVSAKGEGDVDH
jgi:aspartyl-tRNA synthetase